MTIPSSSRRPSAVVVRWLALGLVGMAFAGCNFIRNYGSGSHLDEPREKVRKTNTAKAATMQAEVVTNEAGQVVTIQIVRSSGSAAVDNYVAQSIRDQWPGGPSLRSLVELSYKPGTGFSNPKVLSETPAL